MRMVKTVLTYGSFDQWDQRHVQFLRSLARMGREVIVGCRTDELAAAMATPCQIPFSERRALLERCRFVSRVIPETSVAQKRTDIVNFNVCLLVGHAQDLDALNSLHDIVQIQYLPYFSSHSDPIDMEKRDFWLQPPDFFSRRAL